jgi:hypothetical protein
MPVEVQASRDLALSKGQHRAFFRNPRGNKRYYAFYHNFGNNDLEYEWSSDGITWTNTPIQIEDNTVDTDSFDVKVRDDGSQLVVWVAMISRGEADLKYVRGTISDASDTISWGTVQTVDAALSIVLAGPLCCGIARTDNGRLVIPFTEDVTEHGKDYRQVWFYGSDGDGASPTWTLDSAAWDDPSGNTNNQDKDEVWFSVEGFGEDYPNRFLIVARVPSGSSTTTYQGVSAVPDWNGTAFSNKTQNNLNSGANANSANVISGLVDESDHAHVIYRRGTTAQLLYEKAATAGDDDFGAGILVKNNNIDACTLSLNTLIPPDIPSSTEQNDFAITGASTAHEALDDGLISDNDGDTTYVRSVAGTDFVRVGRFAGGLNDIHVVLRDEGTAASYSVVTLKDGTVVETLLNTTTDGSGTYQTVVATPTDADWNEVRVGHSDTDALRVTAIVVDRHELNAFYHDTADVYNFHYKVMPVSATVWGSEQDVIIGGIPLSTEDNSGFSITGASTVHEAVDDGPMPGDGDTTYVSSTTQGDSFRVGGFVGTIQTSSVRVEFRHTGLSTQIQAFTYKDGVQVEDLGIAGSTPGYSIANFTPTDEDFNEIRIEHTLNANAIRVTNVLVEADVNNLSSWSRDVLGDLHVGLQDGDTDVHYHALQVPGKSFIYAPSPGVRVSLRR